MKTRAASLFYLFVWLCSGFPNQVFGFPEMVRHGYVNCTTCHISPNGGGTLTKYGRSLSEEILSTWHKEGEGQVAYGFIKTPDWLVLHGDFRELQLFTDTPQSKDAQFILMQNDLEAAVQTQGFTVDATLGYYDQSGTVADHIVSRRHYVMYQPAEKFAVRFGQFMRAYGINTPDHDLSVKKGLLMNEGSETYNAEFSYIGEKYDAYVTGVFGRFDNSSLNSESGVALRGSVGLSDSYKVGLSYAFGHGNNDRYTRHLFGPYAILGFTPHFYALAEADLQDIKQPTSTAAKLGAASYVRVGYEFYQGIHLYLTHQYQQTKFGDGNGVHTYGGGFLFYPRPHFEFQSMVQHAVLPQNAGSVEMLAFMAHFYP